LGDKVKNTIIVEFYSTIRPSQHGPELLALLSSLIDKNVHTNQDKASVLVVALALDGIKHLCDAEV